MAIAFKKVTLAPLQAFTASAPDAAVIGIIGENGSGKQALLEVAAAKTTPSSGSVSAGKLRRYLGPGDSLDFSQADVLALDNTFARQDAFSRECAAAALDRVRRQGSTVLILSHEESLLRRLCDEIWWLHEGKLMGRGDPLTMLERYREHVARKLRQYGEGGTQSLANHLRQGDGRAEILGVETLGSNGQQTMVWRSGEDVTVRVSVKFNQQVNDPVIGIHQEHKRQPVIANELHGLGIHLVFAHHVEHCEVRNILQKLVQLDEPRFGEGSPIDRAVERDDHAAAAVELAQRHRFALDVRQREVR